MCRLRLPEGCGQMQSSSCSMAARPVLPHTPVVAWYALLLQPPHPHHHTISSPTPHLSPLQIGAAMGGLQFIMFATYGVAFVYGAWRVSLGLYTGGQVLTVLLAVMMGGFQLGMVGGRLAARQMLLLLLLLPVAAAAAATGRSHDSSAVGTSLPSCSTMSWLRCVA
jgi:hypothetical protein